MSLSAYPWVKMVFSGGSTQLLGCLCLHRSDSHQETHLGPQTQPAIVRDSTLASAPVSILMLTVCSRMGRFVNQPVWGQFDDFFLQTMTLCLDWWLCLAGTFVYGRVSACTVIVPPDVTFLCCCDLLLHNLQITFVRLKQRWCPVAGNIVSCLSHYTQVCPSSLELQFL